MKYTDVAIIDKENVGFIMNDGETVKPWAKNDYSFLEDFLKHLDE